MEKNILKLLVVGIVLSFVFISRVDSENIAMNVADVFGNKEVFLNEKI